jgi:hypothetical protein
MSGFTLALIIFGIVVTLLQTVGLIIFVLEIRAMRRQYGNGRAKCSPTPEAKP